MKKSQNRLRFFKITKLEMPPFFSTRKASGKGFRMVAPKRQSVSAAAIISDGMSMAIQQEELGRAKEPQR